MLLLVDEVLLLVDQLLLVDELLLLVVHEVLLLVGELLAGWLAIMRCSPVGTWMNTERKGGRVPPFISSLSLARGDFWTNVQAFIKLD